MSQCPAEYHKLRTLKNDFKTPAISAGERPPWKTILFSVVLILVSLSLLATSFLALEITVRLNRGLLFSTERVAGKAGDALRHAKGLTGGPRPIAAHDPYLGYIPTPNLQGIPSYKVTVSTDAAGMRQNGAGPRPSGTAILAVGDSFTFGLEVHDDETWPARLERLLERPVFNAGVFGYGLDQMVLRAEKLVEKREDVELVILAVFGDDIARCEYSWRWASKPYFEIRGGRLKLRNVPVPEGYAPVMFASLRNVLEYSHLADVLLTRVAPNWWLVKGGVRHEHDQGDQVASLLLKRWSDFARQHDIRTLFVALVAWPDETAELKALTRHAKRAGLEVLDLSGPLWKMIKADKKRWQAPHGHLTREGNEWVAVQIAARLVSSPTGRPGLTQ
jgi:hypothetical protein